MKKTVSKIFPFTLTLFTMLLLYGCGSTANTTPPSPPAQTSPETSETVEENDDTKAPVDAAEPAPGEPDESVPKTPGAVPASDPLAGFDVLCPGSKACDDPDVIPLTQFFMDSTSTKPSDILMVNADDFENTGGCAAFIFVGTRGSDEYDVPYEGSLWFTDGTDCEKLTEDNESWWSIDGTIKYEKRKFAYINAYYATAAVSYIYEVKNGKAEECSISRLGSASQTDSLDVLITVSAYDACYDKEMDLTIGHTWKPYYFYYDEEKDCIAEYEGTLLDIAEINGFTDFDLVGQIQQQGNLITSAYYRANGIINVNYQTEDDSFVTYKNASYDCHAKCFIDALGTGENTLESSDFGGMYYSSIYMPQE